MWGAAQEGSARLLNAEAQDTTRAPEDGPVDGWSSPV